MQTLGAGVHICNYELDSRLLNQRLDDFFSITKLTSTESSGLLAKVQLQHKAL